MHTEIEQTASQNMQQVVESFEQSLSKVRTGRAHPGLLNSVVVLSYESEVPLNQVASVNVVDSQTLAVTPWDKALVPAIEKAIAGAGLGLNPSVNGAVVHVPLPLLTAERRQDLVKLVRAESESARVSVRNHRREAISGLKDLLKSNEISEDDERRMVARVQKLTDDHIGKIDCKLREKESDLLNL